MKYYSFRQNNSGGYFMRSEVDGIDIWVIVEARNSRMANALFSDISRSYQQYCHCCGERWDNVREEDGTDIPTVYNTPLNKWEPFDVENGYIHFLDGRKEKFILKPKSNA